MTRGRNGNTAHLVAETIQDARNQWVGVFSRDRADLGPTHARRLAADAADKYGPDISRRPAHQPSSRSGANDPRQPSPAPSGPVFGI